MLERKPVNLIVLPGRSADGSPRVSEDFAQRLRQYDRSLLVTWNTRVRRFVITQCVEHHASGYEHSHLCRQIPVVTVQDSDGHMMPLGESVIQMIRAADNEKKGYGPHDLAKFCADKQRELEDERAGMEKEQEAVIRYGSRHNRRQLMQAIHLIQQHNLTPNQ